MTISNDELSDGSGVADEEQSSCGLWLVNF
jgi:hypothetical protein